MRARPPDESCWSATPGAAERAQELEADAPLCASAFDDTAVVKAIERNKVEISVAPVQQRLLAHFALASPGISVKVASGESGQKAAANVAKGQLDKR